MSKNSIIMLHRIPVPVRLTAHGEKVLKGICEKSDPYLAELFEKAKQEDSLYMLWRTNAPYITISIDENGSVFTCMPIPMVDVEIKRDEFKPVPVRLSEHGRELVNASVNFREAEQIYMLEPATEFNNVKVGVDEKGSTFMYVPEDDVLGLYYEQKG